MTTQAAEPKAGSGTRTLSTIDIQNAIPHRYPFLLVDTVEITETGKRATGTKSVTINEPFFQGHFPGHPIMPGVLIVEALAQTACVLLKADGAYADKIAYFLGIEEAKFRNPVLPGSQLKLDIEVLKLGGRAGKFKGTARIGDKVACEAQMTFVLADKGK